jgi:gamma-glutamylcyclotransferase (GGCT)/AIG2-like uncharacterized protein YtfP
MTLEMNAQPAVSINKMSESSITTMTNQPDLLFVYGSMTEGRVHYGRVAEFVKETSSAFLKGSAYRLESGYPVFSSDGIDLVPGTLLRLDAPSTLWKVLDELNGCSPANPDKSLFHRVTTLAEVDGKSVECQVYVVNPCKLPRSASKIAGGDWLGDISEREPMVTLLTTNQRNYIQKLGRSTGRDIVPINLDLYRELMNKGLIVDKGRRLALTSLGQEVFRYLE